MGQCTTEQVVNSPTHHHLIYVVVVISLDHSSSHLRVPTFSLTCATREGVRHTPNCDTTLPTLFQCTRRKGTFLVLLVVAGDLEIPRTGIIISTNQMATFDVKNGQLILMAPSRASILPIDIAHQVHPLPRREERARASNKTIPRLARTLPVRRTQKPPGDMPEEDDSQTQSIRLRGGERTFRCFFKSY